MTTLTLPSYSACAATDMNPSWERASSLTVDGHERMIPRKLKRCHTDDEPIRQRKKVQFADSDFVLPICASSQAETWCQATDYNNFQQDRRQALCLLLESLANDLSVHASAYIGIEQQLDQDQFIARKLECRQYTQLMVIQQHMKEDSHFIQAATQSFAFEASQRAVVRAVTSLWDE